MLLVQDFAQLFDMFCFGSVKSDAVEELFQLFCWDIDEVFGCLVGLEQLVGDGDSGGVFRPRAHHRRDKNLEWSIFFPELLEHGD